VALLRRAGLLDDVCYQGQSRTRGCACRGPKNDQKAPSKNLEGNIPVASVFSLRERALIGW
jgi:hypothetical protein